MSFYYANARQPEILRTVQKDLNYSDNVGQKLADIIRFTNNYYWIKYNDLFQLIGQLMYHGYTSTCGLQTLGEEYTGIIQIDSKYISLPSKLIQFTSIILEFGGELIFYKLLKILERDIESNADLLPTAKSKLLKLCKLIRQLAPFIKALHRSLFYINGNKYQLSKRILGINYVRVRHWLNVNYSPYGYKVLGFITLLQLFLVFVTNVKLQLKNSNSPKPTSTSLTKTTENQQSQRNAIGIKCVLCLEVRQNTSTMVCGHLFCWNCILDWLDQKEECPVCREKSKKSMVVFLKNL